MLQKSRKISMAELFYAANGFVTRKYFCTSFYQKIHPYMCVYRFYEYFLNHFNKNWISEWLVHNRNLVIYLHQKVQWPWIQRFEIISSVINHHQPLSGKVSSLKVGEMSPTRFNNLVFAFDQFREHQSWALVSRGTLNDT